MSIEIIKKLLNDNKIRKVSDPDIKKVPYLPNTITKALNLLDEGEITIEDLNNMAPALCTQVAIKSNNRNYKHAYTCTTADSKNSGNPMRKGVYAKDTETKGADAKGTDAGADAKGTDADAKGTGADAKGTGANSKSDLLKSFSNNMSKCLECKNTCKIEDMDAIFNALIDLKQNNATLDKKEVEAIKVEIRKIPDQCKLNYHLINAASRAETTTGNPRQPLFALVNSIKVSGGSKSKTKKRRRSFRKKRMHKKSINKRMKM